MKEKLGFLFAALAIAGIMLFMHFRNRETGTPEIGVPSALQDSSQTNRADPNRKDPDLEVVHKDSVAADGARFIVGRVRSKSQKKYDYMEVNFTLKDRAGNTLGVVTANGMQSAGGGEWHFSVPTENAQASGYELTRAVAW